MFVYTLSWDEFKTQLAVKLSQKVKSDISDFLFRGQASSDWILSSSFDRIEADKSKYKLLIQNFKKICSYYNYNEDLLKSEDVVIAAYAQHYGLPTRLMDWTLSPYYAAFFAFSEAGFHYVPGDVCTIWAINKNSVALQKKLGIEFIDISSNKFNYRMRNQIGHFTLSSHSEDSIEIFDENLISATGINDLLWRFNITIPSKTETILKDLDLMGINFSTVYPDIQGFIKESIFKSEVGKK